MDEIERLMEALENPSPSMIDAFVARALQVSLSAEYGWSDYARDQWLTMLAAFRRENGV